LFTNGEGVNLEEITNLNSCYVPDTEITDAGVAELKKTLPNCMIHH